VLRYRTGDVTAFVDEPCSCGRTHRRIARFSGRVDDMLVVRGINVFPCEIEAVVLADPACGGQYAIVVDRRAALPELEVHVEVDGQPDGLERRLERRLRLRVQLVTHEPGSLPRTETGKAKRLFERVDDAPPW